MAKTPQNSFKKGPWNLKNKGIDAFMKVTPENRKQAIVQGRIMYVIMGTGNPYTYNGFFTIDPCFTKGWWRLPLAPFMIQSDGVSHWRCFINEDVVRIKWASDYNTLITRHIEKGELYIKSTDPILTYIKEK